jgi:transaldolase
LQSLITSGTKLWLDSIDPAEVARNRAWGATGATSNPIIVSDLIETGQFDALMTKLIKEGLSDQDLAWQMTDTLVKQAMQVFLPVWQETKGDNGYVSFELDPLLEDPAVNLPVAERTKHYIELGKKWAAGQQNRMIKVPATPGGLGALEELCAAGVTLNVTLVFTERQYHIARDNIWRGAQRRKSLDGFKSVYSIFVSRVDVYTEHHVPELSPAAQGMVGIVNAKHIWKLNQRFWADKKTPLKQEMIFASTGVKKPEDPAKTNADVQASGRTITRQIDKLPPKEVIDEIAAKVDVPKMEAVLMQEGIKKFADPQHALLKLIAQKRAALMAKV